MNRYEEAKESYKELGIYTDKALDILKEIPISINCWQGDDVLGFDGSTSLQGGIQTTGNYPYRPKTPEQLMDDITFAFAHMPGKKRLNLHASYAILGDDKGKVDRDEYTIKYFLPWIDFVKKIGGDGIDFNPTFFSHPNVVDNLSLSTPNEELREFWVRHGRRSMEISKELAKAFGKPCVCNIWIPDGYKDIPADRLGPRMRLKKSLDEMLEGYDKEWVIPTVESKLFGIGIEAFTVGSNDFYENYAATRGITLLMDMGHYHPTEVVSEKISSILCFAPRVALHVSRPMRWDSDHVVLFDDELREVAKEIVRNDAIDRVTIALDYFDASINRLSAWITGQRSVEKALLWALLTPNKELKEAQDTSNFTKLMYLAEHTKDMPFSDVWNEYLRRQGLKEDYYSDVVKYEDEVLCKR